MKKVPGFFMLIGLIALAGCASASARRQDVQDNGPNSLTVGKVQRDIRLGMSSAQVAEVLGSPNMVTTDEERREVWVYDKIASDVTYSQGGGYWTLILFGSDRQTGATATAQRTLTVVIKFDKEGKVRDFAYNSSKF
jgi:outer membrane protein assembly factor BamE (lipoprotein component of BamABCDE complex)